MDTQSNENAAGGATGPATPTPEEVQRAADEAVARHNAEVMAAARAALGENTPPPDLQPMDAISLNPQHTETAAETADAPPGTTGVVSAPVVDSPTSAKPKDAPRKSRAEVAAMREAERSAGVDYYLPVTQEWAKVRDLPFSDYVMIQGIPAELRDEIDATIRDRRIREIVAGGENTVMGLNETVETYAKAEAMANAVCIAAFISPRLVMREGEIPPGDPDVWLVSDLHIDERMAFLTWSNRNRALRNDQEGGAAASAGFPGAGVGSPTDSATGNPVQ